MTEFDISLGSVPHRERLVADIFYNNKHFAEISHDNDEIIIEFYSNRDKGYWEFSFDEALQVLEKARLKLATMGKNFVPDKIFITFPNALTSNYLEI